MILVLEGPDNTGKTTYGLKLVAEGHYDGYRHYFPGVAANFEQILRDAEFYNSHNTVLDRWWLSEVAYYPETEHMFDDHFEYLLDMDGISYEIWVHASDSSPIADRYRQLAQAYELPLIDPATMRWTSVQAEEKQWDNPIVRASGCTHTYGICDDCLDKNGKEEPREASLPWGGKPSDVFIHCYHGVPAHMCYENHI